MPYDSVDQLPSYIQTLPAKHKRQWLHVFNDAMAKCTNGGTNDRDDCESRSFAQANGVVIKKGEAKHSMGARNAKNDSDVNFKKLSYQARQDIPKKKFLFIDSEGKPHLPVHDQSHIRNAISRLGNPKTGRKWGLSTSKRASLQARARRMLDRAEHGAGPHIGPAGNLAMDVATFKMKGAPVRMTDDVVYRQATIFRAGEYPDKDFSLTPSELKAAAAKFDTPINVDYEHVDGPLDGHMGQLVTVQPSEDGSTLHGMLAVPRWLYGILPKAKLSATWDKASKTLVGLGLVRNPRVPDAALFAAFSVDQVARGQQPPESLFFNGVDDDDDDDDGDDDDKAVSPQDRFKAMLEAKKKGAKNNVKAKKQKAKFAGYDGMVPTGGWASQSGGSRDGLSGDVGGKGRQYALGKGPYGGSKQPMAQAIHDISVGRGAVCRVEPQAATGTPGPFGIVRFDRKGKPRIDKQAWAEFANGAKAIQGIHDVSLAMGANCVPTLYGQQDLAGAGPFQWQYPGVKDYGYTEVVKGGMTQPHFSNQEGKRSKMGKKNKAQFGQFLTELDRKAGVQTPSTYAYAGSAPAVRKSQTEAERAMAERTAVLEEENRQMRQQGIYDRAVSFADRAQNEMHILPVEREDVVRMHMQCAHDDTFVGTASFSDGNSRVSMFEQYILGRPKLNVNVEETMEALRGATAVFNRMRTAVVPGAANLPGVDSGAPMAPERKEYLLKLADSGTMTGQNLARPNGTAKK